MLSVPLGRRLIDSIPAELLDDQLAASGEPVGDLIDGRIQVLDVVQRIAGDCCIKRPSLTKLLQGGASKDRPVWSFRIDGEDVVPGCVYRSRQGAGAAADLENSR